MKKLFLFVIVALCLTAVSNLAVAQENTAKIIKTEPVNPAKLSYLLDKITVPSSVEDLTFAFVSRPADWNEGKRGTCLSLGEKGKLLCSVDDDPARYHDMDGKRQKLRAEVETKKPNDVKIKAGTETVLVSCKSWQVVLWEYRGSSWLVLELRARTMITENNTSYDLVVSRRYEARDRSGFKLSNETCSSEKDGRGLPCTILED